jgi:hypothetical protein
MKLVLVINAVAITLSLFTLYGCDIGIETVPRQCVQLAVAHYDLIDTCH